MEQASLTISLPKSMKEFIEAKLRQGRFSTPSEYIRSLIRDDQDFGDRSEIAALVRHATYLAQAPSIHRENGKQRK